MRTLLVALVLTLVPLAAAQQATDEDAVPVGDTPDVHTPEGPVEEGAGAPTEQESLEEDEGFAYGGAILIGMIVFVAALGYASWRYAKRPPSM